MADTSGAMGTYPAMSPFVTDEYRQLMIQGPHCLWCGTTLTGESPETLYCGKTHARNAGEFRNRQSDVPVTVCPHPEKLVYGYRGTALRSAAWHGCSLYQCDCAAFHLTSHPMNKTNRDHVCELRRALFEQWMADVMYERGSVFVFRPVVDNSDETGFWVARYPGAQWSAQSGSEAGALKLLAARESKLLRCEPIYAGWRSAALQQYLRDGSAPGVYEIPLAANLAILNDSDPTAALEAFIAEQDSAPTGRENEATCELSSGDFDAAHLAERDSHETALKTDPANELLAG